MSTKTPSDKPAIAALFDSPSEDADDAAHAMGKRADVVRTRDDLVALIDHLRADLALKPELWTNPELPEFLEAMGAWVQDMDGFYKNVGEDMTALPPWRIFADILVAAREYE